MIWLSPADQGLLAMDERLVDLLAEYDEQVRSGSQSESAVQDEAPELSPVLKCVDFVERVWPRRSEPFPNLSAKTHVGRFQIERLLG